MSLRWNGWGDTAVEIPLPDPAAVLLARLVGEAQSPRDAVLADVVATVPPSRLGDHHRLISTDPQTRLLHARGQSLPDWVALRSGRIGSMPDGVAIPATEEDLAELFSIARASGSAIVPRGGGTSVVGGLAPAGDRPTITVSLGGLAGLRGWDERSGLATVGPGTSGPALEESLAVHGRTVGHYPQSFEQSTVGGWIATRSSGQESMGYGRIEDLFAGGRLIAPAGTLDMPPYPASAAGPDLRQAILGSEGRFGFVSEAILRTTAIPEVHPVLAFAMRDWSSGLACARDLGHLGRPLSMVRLASAAETRTTLALAPGRRSANALSRYLRLRRLGPERCLLLVAAAGRRRAVRTITDEAVDVVHRHRGVPLSWTGIGRRWMAERFRTPYLRNTLWDAGYAVDTLETATEWSRVDSLASAIVTALRGALDVDGERVFPFAHLSHVYPSGSSIYVTYVFRQAADPDETLDRWRRCKTAASDAIVAGRGTISHQHGIGTDHRPWLAAEKGPLGIRLLDDLARQLDPDGLMSHGVLAG